MDAAHIDFIFSEMPVCNLPTHGGILLKSDGAKLCAMTSLPCNRGRFRSRSAGRSADRPSRKEKHSKKKDLHFCFPRATIIELFVEGFSEAEQYAAVAQLDRVFGYEPKGRGFESLQPYQIA